MIVCKQQQNSPRKVERPVLWSTEQQCPFFNQQQQRCCAAVGTQALSPQRKILCCSDEYDDCPSYLAYLLRRSRALRSDCDWLDAS
jgi:hypothetical protein